MVDEQTKRAVETMAQCGCELESLISMFPNIPKEDVVAIWNYIWDAGHTDDDCYIAHKFSSKHRTELEKDKVCGCFDCLRIFSPSEIEEWVPETPDGESVTAVCPYCGDDSIIGESSGYPITKEFLKKMHDRWMCQA